VTINPISFYLYHAFLNSTFAAWTAIAPTASDAAFYIGHRQRTLLIFPVESKSRAEPFRPKIARFLDQIGADFGRRSGP